MQKRVSKAVKNNYYRPGQGEGRCGVCNARVYVWDDQGTWKAYSHGTSRIGLQHSPSDNSCKGSNKTVSEHWTEFRSL